MADRNYSIVKAAAVSQPNKYHVIKSKKKWRGGSSGDEPPRNFDAYKFLSSLPEFSHLPVDALKDLAAASHLSTIEAGKYISLEGEEHNSSGFIVVSGCLAMLKSSIRGKELIVELLQSGDIFGLLLMLAGGDEPEQLSARTLQKCEVLWMPITNFTYFLTCHPSVFKEFVAHLLRCLQSSYSLSRGLAHDRVDVRVAAVLLNLAFKFPPTKATGRGHALNFTRQQLADLAGTTPETAIRTTGAMQRKGIIDIKRPGIIRIIDLQALQELAEG